jgi:hypothetical protein
MSGRIRTIKPELLDDAVTAGLSDMAFRLFVSSLVLADDYGRLRAEPAWLMGQIYWTRTIQVEEFLSALKELIPLMLFYEVNGQRYAEIRNWAKHQKVSHPGKPRVPTPPEILPRSSGESRETLVPDLRSPIPITDQGSPTTTGATPAGLDTRPKVSVPDPESPEPDWWAGVLETIETGTGVAIAGRESWLRYAGHRNTKRMPATRADAVQWLSAVMVKEARDAREKARQQKDRDAKYDGERAKQREAAAAPQPYHRVSKPSAAIPERLLTDEERVEGMKRLTAMIGKVGT